MATKTTEILQSAQVNGLTGEVTYTNLTSAELEQRQADLIESAALQAEADAKAAARTSALAKLADLGLTAEEIAAL